MNSGELLRWRTDVLKGRKKYYPKDLIPAVIAMVQPYPVEQVAHNANKKIDNAA